MAETDTKTGPNGLPLGLEAVVDSMKDKGPETRVSLALFMAVTMQLKHKKLTDEQFFDVFHAGMRAHRVASTSSFLDLFFKDDAAIDRLRLTHGLSVPTLAKMALTAAEETAKASAKFMTLTEMFEGVKS
jgi:hypothetical protein